MFSLKGEVCSSFFFFFGSLVSKRKFNQVGRPILFIFVLCHRRVAIYPSFFFFLFVLFQKLFFC